MNFLSMILKTFGPAPKPIPVFDPMQQNLPQWFGPHKASVARAYRRSQVAFHGRRQAIKLIKANRRAAKLASI